MYNFEQHLTTNEQILYQGRAEPGKGGKSSKSLFIVLIMLIIIQIIMIASIQSNTPGGSGGISLNFIIIFLTTIAFEILIIYGIVYDLFLKKKEIKNVYYCLTNKRALEFDEKTNVLRFGHLIYYEEIKIYNEKNNYGDVYMGIILANQVGDAKTIW